MLRWIYYIVGFIRISSPEVKTLGFHLVSAYCCDLLLVVFLFLTRVMVSTL